MDGPRGYYAKCNKSDREKQIPSDFNFMWILKKQNIWTNKKKRLIETENKVKIARGE